MCKNFMVIRHSIKELLAKSMITQPMKWIVVRKEEGNGKQVAHCCRKEPPPKFRNKPSLSEPARSQRTEPTLPILCCKNFSFHPSIIILLSPSFVCNDRIQVWLLDITRQINFNSFLI